VVHYAIPNNLTGLLIGRNGENLKKLMAKTGTYIHVPKASEGGSSERVIQIKGTKKQVDDVKREIALLVSSNAHGRMGSNAVQLREKQQAVSAITMYLPPSCKMIRFDY